MQQIAHIAVYTSFSHALLLPVPLDHSILVEQVYLLSKTKIENELIGKQDLFNVNELRIFYQHQLLYPYRDEQQNLSFQCDTSCEKLFLHFYQLPKLSVQLSNTVDILEPSTIQTVLNNSPTLYINHNRCLTLFQQVDLFVKQQEEQRLNFPSSLSSSERNFVHVLARTFQLHHQSQGSNDKRYIFLRKPKTLVKQVTNDDTLVLLEKPKKRDKIPSGITEVILGFLYLGSGNDAHNLPLLESLGIQYILNVTQEWPFHKNLPAQMICKRLLVKDVVEEIIIPHTVEEAISFINKAKQDNARIFVHCTVGKSRSASIILAYLMHSCDMDLMQAMEHLKQRRPIIEPNDGFVRQLFKYEQMLKGPNYSTRLEWKFKESEDERLARQEEEIKRANRMKLLAKAVSHAVPDDYLLEKAKILMENQFKKELVGQFMTYMVQEVQERESIILNQVQLELEKYATDITPSQLKNAVAKRMREWYLGKIEKL